MPANLSTGKWQHFTTERVVDTLQPVTLVQLVVGLK